MGDDAFLQQTRVEPDRIFRVSYFFIDHWLPLLGPAQAWLVVALQQACLKDEAGVGQISQTDLGRLCGLKRQQVNVHLRQAKTGRNLLAWFVADIQPHFGAGQPSCRYRLWPEPPLTPDLATGLEYELARLLMRHDPQAALAELLAQEHHTLLDRLATVKGRPRSRPTVTGIVTALVGDPLDPETKALATRLRRHMLQPGRVYLGTEYFRQEWAPRLGPAAAWLITVLRRHAGLGERPGEFSVTKGALAARLGVAGQTMMTKLKEPALTPFFTELTIGRHLISGTVLVGSEPRPTAEKAGLRQAHGESETSPAGRRPWGEPGRLWPGEKER